MSNPKWAIKAITDSNKIPSNITHMLLTVMESKTQWPGSLIEKLSIGYLWLPKYDF